MTMESDESSGYHGEQVVISRTEVGQHRSQLRMMVMQNDSVMSVCCVCRRM